MCCMSKLESQVFFSEKWKNTWEMDEVTPPQRKTKSQGQDLRISFQIQWFVHNERKKRHKVKKGALPLCVNFHFPDAIWISGSGEEIPCHKVILVAQSPYLRSILTSLDNNCESAQFQYIVTPEFTSEAIKTILGRLLQNKVKNELVRLLGKLDLYSFLWG